METGHVHLFEATIDLLSYASLEQMSGRRWREHDMLSLAGVFKMKSNDKAPVALTTYLEGRKVTTIHLHLDNDDVGRGASEGIMRALGSKYQVLDEPPAFGKDMNETLMRVLDLKRNERKEERVR